MKRFFSLLLTAAMLVGGLSIAPASAVDVNKTLRVRLTIDSASTFADPKLENVSGYDGGYTFGTMDGTTFQSDKSVSNTQLTVKLVGNAFQVSDTTSGTVLYTTKAGAEHLAIRPNSKLTWFKGYKWYGDFVYKASGSSLTVTNYVGLEDYVKGVLPYEVNASWPIEALKAQAVCARSFALGTNKHASDGYDLCNTTNCQVYKGANNATDNSDKAVDETKGEYLMYDGKLAIGYFFSSDGGATEDAVNVWGGDYGYLKGKEDPYEDVENAYNGVWSVTLTAAEVRSKVTAAGYSIGEVASVEVTKRTATDNVNEVTVTDTAGKKVTISKDAVRTVFGLNSIRYKITPNTAGQAGGTAAAEPKAGGEVRKISVSSHKVTVDGKPAAPQGYNINDNNYFKLRDIAYILNGTDAQFNVVWDGKNNQIRLESNTAYEEVGGEMTAAASAKIENCTPSDSEILLDGQKISLVGYRVNGNNYYMVRDVGAALGFGVDWDTASQTVKISSETKTTPPVTNAASYTFNGTGWGHSVGMSQYGALGMAKKGFSYDEILKFYYTGIQIQK